MAIAFYFPIGTYTAEVLCYLNTAPTYENGGILTGGTPIGDSPFAFQIESPQVLQQKIAQNPRGITANELAITIIIAIILSAIITYVVATKVKLFKSLKNSGTLIALLSLVFTVIGVLLQYLQLLR